MKKLLFAGIPAIVVVLFIAACANPLAVVDEDGNVTTSDPVVTDVSTVSGFGAIQVNWTDPSVDFGSVEVSYSTGDADAETVSVDPGTETVTVTDLTDDAEYDFVLTVIASNGVRSSETATATATEGAPVVQSTSVSVTGGGQVTITWEAPAIGDYDRVTIDYENQADSNDNGSTDWDRIVTADVGNKTDVEVEQDATVDVTGLTVGAAYDFTFTAIELDDDGNVADTSTATATANGIDIISSTLTINFSNFIDSAGVTTSLPGGWSVDDWGNGFSTYEFTFDGSGNGTVTISDQTSFGTILFRLANSDWSTPTGVDYSVLEPNAWNDVTDGHSYDSGDSNWAIGNDGEAKPSGDFQLGTDYTITIDADPDDNSAVDSRATLAIDGTVVWQ